MRHRNSNIKNEQIHLNISRPLLFILQISHNRRPSFRIIQQTTNEPNKIPVLKRFPFHKNVLSSIINKTGLN
jgi:hypothetical protein